MDFGSSNAGRAKGFCNFNACAFWAGENVSLSDRKFHKQATWCFPTKQSPRKKSTFPWKNYHELRSTFLNEARIYHHQLRGGRSAKWTPEKKNKASCCIALHCLVGWFFGLCEQGLFLLRIRVVTLHRWI